MSISDNPTDVATQESLADSLVAPLDSEGQPLAQEYGEQEYGQEQGGEGQLNERDEINARLWEQAEQIERDSQQETGEQQVEQPIELTPQAVQESIQQLDQTVNDLGLNDPAEAALLASSLGVDPAHSAPLGSVLAKTTLSALSVLEQCRGDLSQIGQIPREAAQAFSNDFLRAIGMDPRMSNANPEQLAGVVLHGTLNFIKAVEAHGLQASLDVLNDPQASEWFANALFQCFGSGERADRQYALALADSGGRYILSVLRRLDGAQQSQQARPGRQSQSRQSQGRRAAPARQRSSARVQMRTNADIFDDEAMDYYQMQHGRL